MAHKVSLKIDGESINVDPLLLFQRLVMAAGEDTETLLKFSDLN